MLQSPDARNSWSAFRKGVAGTSVFAALVLSIFAFMFAATQSATPCASAQFTGCEVGDTEIFASTLQFSDGGSVNQSTSKATGVTLTTVTGQINTDVAALAAGADVSFVLTNSHIAVDDVLIVNHADGGTAGAYSVGVSRVAAGSATITISNISAGALGESLRINFVLIKGSSS